MNLKRFIAAFAAAAALASPVHARLETRTGDMLRLAEDYGATVVVNPARCKAASYNGTYQPSTKIITLCHNGVADADDHNTARHEVWHFIQHCASDRRAQQGLQPIAVNTTLRSQWVNRELGASMVQRIKELYDPAVWQIELEAFAAAEDYTATEIMHLMRSWCTR